MYSFMCSFQEGLGEHGVERFSLTTRCLGVNGVPVVLCCPFRGKLVVRTEGKGSCRNAGSMTCFVWGVRVGGGQSTYNA